MRKVGNACKDYSNGECYDACADDDGSESREFARHDFEVSPNGVSRNWSLINDVREKSNQHSVFPLYVM